MGRSSANSFLPAKIKADSFQRLYSADPSGMNGQYYQHNHSMTQDRTPTSFSMNTNYMMSPP
jgi:hypothetical protein